MGLEAASFVNDLVVANPVGGVDQKAQGDDHLRLLKTVLKATFPLAVGAYEFRNDDAGATLTHIMNMWRKSASPLAGDLLAAYDISFDSSTAVKRTAVRLLGRADTVTNGAEVTSALLQVMLAGALTTVLTLPMVHNNPGMILVPTNKTYNIILKAAFPFTLLETTTICASGTITATFKKNGVAIGGAANSVTSAESSVAHTDTFAAGDDLTVTLSANAACLDMAFNVKIRRDG